MSDQIKIVCDEIAARVRIMTLHVSSPKQIDTVVSIEFEKIVRPLIEALESVEEYWNGNSNMKAMEDACHHNVEIAAAALAPFRTMPVPERKEAP